MSDRTLGFAENWHFFSSMTKKALKKKRVAPPPPSPFVDTSATLRRQQLFLFPSS
jgi:hypothetical protein